MRSQCNGAFAGYIYAGAEMEYAVGVERRHNLRYLRKMTLDATNYAKLDTPTT